MKFAAVEQKVGLGIIKKAIRMGALLFKRRRRG